MALTVVQKTETLHILPDHDGLPERHVTVVSISFEPSRLEVWDLNHPQLTRDLFGPKALKKSNWPHDGLRASELIGSVGMENIAAVTGGIYFANISLPNSNHQPNGFIFFSPRPGEGLVLSRDVENSIATGGLLVFDQDGKSRLIRTRNFKY